MTVLCLCLEPSVPPQQDATQPHCTRSADAAGFPLGSEGKASAKSKKKGLQQGIKRFAAGRQMRGGGRLFI